jgi:Ulp1 family protease
MCTSSPLIFSTLDKKGTKEVASWTRNEKKIIDIFEKKFIFVPVNGKKHWSLCVVVNPGHKLKAHQLNVGSLLESEKHGEWPW